MDDGEGKDGARDDGATTRAPCLRVPREAGERTRQALAEAGLLDDRYRITVEGGWIYVPVAGAAVGSGPDPDPGDELGGRLDPGDDVEWEVVVRPVEYRDARTTPTDLLDFSPTYERLGDVAILEEDEPDRAREAADAIVASDVPVGTVINRASEVRGQLRVREFDVLAGEDVETVHREYGCEYLLDPREVYFSPRLATERHRVAEGVVEGEHAFDMFAGVGPFVVPFAKRGADCAAVDLNPAAVRYLRENVRRNGVADRVRIHEGDVREVARDPDLGYGGWADRVVMNLPHSADDFLDTAVHLAGEDCLVHYYDIQPDADPFGPGERAIRAAAEPEYEVTVETRRTVRSYAPRESNVVLDVRLTR